MIPCFPNLLKCWNFIIGNKSFSCFPQWDKCTVFSWKCLPNTPIWISIGCLSVIFLKLNGVPWEKQWGQSVSQRITFQDNMALVQQMCFVQISHFILECYRHVPGKIEVYYCWIQNLLLLTTSAHKEEDWLLRKFDTTALPRAEGSAGLPTVAFADHQYKCPHTEKGR